MKYKFFLFLFIILTTVCCNSLVSDCKELRKIILEKKTLFTEIAYDPYGKREVKDKSFDIQNILIKKFDPENDILDFTGSLIYKKKYKSSSEQSFIQTPKMSDSEEEKMIYEEESSYEEEKGYDDINYSCKVDKSGEYFLTLKVKQLEIILYLKYLNVRSLPIIIPARRVSVDSYTSSLKVQ